MYSTVTPSGQLVNNKQIIPLSVFIHRMLIKSGRETLISALPLFATKVDGQKIVMVRGGSMLDLGRPHMPWCWIQVRRASRVWDFIFLNNLAWKEIFRPFG